VNSCIHTNDENLVFDVVFVGMVDVVEEEEVDGCFFNSLTASCNNVFTKSSDL
jgi:hypothetical protein